MSNIYRTHTCGELSKKEVGSDVTLSGWVHRKRDHGGLLFVDLRDNYGITQCVFDLGDKGLSEIEKVHPESVIRVKGAVIKRDDDQINSKIPTGEVEVKVASFDVLTHADILPVQVFGDEDTAEELRFKYRFLDLRRETLHKNISVRNKVVKFIRDKMWELGFSEFQTPILTVSSPEGARDFLVPSRIHHGMFYALPQSPQQFKQLLQVAGFDRYFQIAPCFRDEDSRSDRLLEHYQLDFEMSFVEASDIQAVGNAVITSVLRAFIPNAKVSDDIPHISYGDAMLKYGTDKPDLRNPILIGDVGEVFRGSDFGVFADLVERGAVVRAIPAPNTANKPRGWFDKNEEFATTELGLAGLGYIVFAEEGPKGPVAKKLDSARISKIKEISGLKNGDSVFFVCEKENIAAKAAGKLRARFGKDLGLIDDNEYRMCWVEDFPMFELNEETGKIDFGHNPFTMPKSDLSGDPLKIAANQFDCVMNGMELCSGALRNYNPETMLEVFAIAGYGEDEVKAKFGGMWNAFQYGAPPHGGCGFGIDRIVMIVLKEPSMREIVAFPMNQRGQDLMMGAPGEVSENQLREAHIQVRKRG
ncbi:MAG: aspartate--tRNA ligase [Rickettsiales bacterium]|jgi:aspartyl-tRNA synthetase|nr:aspartate--tRNA ligase [Rickettsiales bacterium]